MMAYAYKTDEMVRLIQAKLEHKSYTDTPLLSWFKTIGNIQNIGEGLIKKTITTIEKMEPGELVSDLSSLPTNAPRFSETTTTLATYGAKIVIPMRLMDQWRSNSQIDVQIADILNEQTKAFMIQVEQFLANGDAMPNPRTNDRASGESVFKGIFSGGTAFGAGDGADNNMSAAGDYQSTVSTAVEALETAGHQSKVGYYMFSDNTTKHTAERGIHQLNTVVFTNEKKAIDQDPQIIEWIASPNYLNSSSESKILITNPFTNPVPGGNETEFAYRLLISYDMKVIPLNGGNINSQLNYEYAVVWSGAIEFINAAAIQVSGALTLT